MMTSLRLGFIALLTGLLLSCGGGGGGGGGGAGGSFGVVAPAGNGSGTATGGESIPSGAASGGSGGASGGTGGSAGGTGGSDGPGAGVSASAGGDDGSGVGSGGTGVSTAAATGVGAVDGAGSIFVNGVRYDTTGAVVDLQDATELRLGMSAKVIGPVSADFTTGTAVRIESAADVRGPLTVPDLGQGRFQVLGTTIVTDSATVWADSSGLGAIVPGTTVQVWGLPEAPGLLRATRVEQQPLLAGPILTGTVQNLDSATRTFRLGALVIAYGGAIVNDGLGGTSLGNGTFVRVRADAVLQPGRLTAARIDRWYPVPLAEGSTLQLAGVITGYTGLASLRVLGIPVDASAAQITGGPPGSVGNGVKVEVGGRVTGGVLRATKFKLKQVPGTGGPSSFALIGNVGNFRSSASFRVRGQPIDASGAGVTFSNGSASNLDNGVRVSVEGSQVVDGVLIATRVAFE